MTDRRRCPDDFLEEVREISARRREHTGDPADTARAGQVQAATRDAHRLLEDLSDRVVNVTLGEREEALALALAAAAGRRGLHSQHGPNQPHPEIIDVANPLRGHCDVCDTRAHQLELIIAQYGPYIFRVRACVRCRPFAPDEPLDTTEPRRAA